MQHTDAIDLNQMARSASRASALMKTLGHKDRLMILCHLADGEKSVGHIADLLEISQSPLSQHLSRMRKEGLVDTRREAQTIYYSLRSGEAPPASWKFCTNYFVSPKAAPSDYFIQSA